jgi:hypothetical protein
VSLRPHILNLANKIFEGNNISSTSYASVSTSFAPVSTSFAPVSTSSVIPPSEVNIRYFNIYNYIYYIFKYSFNILYT